MQTDYMCIYAPGASAFLQADKRRAMCKHAYVMGDPDQEAARTIIREMCRITGLSPTGLAKAAGLRPSTITRFLNNPSVTHTLSMRTMRKLEAVVERHLALKAHARALRPNPKPRRRRPTLRVVAPKSKRGQRR